MEEKNEKSLTESVTALTKLVDQLRSQRYLQMVDSPRKFLFYNFLSGIASGVGTAIGASLVFALLIWFLSKLEIVPFLGNWIVTILHYIQTVK